MKLVTHFALVALAVGVPSIVSAHIPLVNPSNHATLKWNVPSSISVVINATGSDDIHDGPQSGITLLSAEVQAPPGPKIDVTDDSDAAPSARTAADGRAERRRNDRCGSSRDRRRGSAIGG